MLSGVDWEKCKPLDSVIDLICAIITRCRINPFKKEKKHNVINVTITTIQRNSKCVSAIGF